MFVLSIRADVDPGSGPLLPRARCGLLGEARRGNGAQGREPLWFGRGRCRPIGALSRTGDLIFARPDRLNTLTARELPCHLASVMTWTAHLASCCVRYTICVAPEFRSASRLEPRVDAAPSQTGGVFAAQAPSDPADHKEVPGPGVSGALLLPGAAREHPPSCIGRPRCRATASNR